MNASFKIGNCVEQKNLGDMPCVVVEVKESPVPGNPSMARYKLIAIDGTKYENIPGYMMVPARPASKSKWPAPIPPLRKPPRRRR